MEPQSQNYEQPWGTRPYIKSPLKSPSAQSEGNYRSEYSTLQLPPDMRKSLPKPHKHADGELCYGYNCSKSPQMHSEQVRGSTRSFEGVGLRDGRYEPTRTRGIVWQDRDEVCSNTITLFVTPQLLLCNTTTVTP
jgi:hypothetical protein